MKIWFCVFLLILTGCASTPPKVIVEETKDEYEILDIDPPKHFYVNIKNLRTGEVSNHVYVSKHYNNWKSIDKGMKLKLTKKLYDDNTSGFDKYEIKDELDRVIAEKNSTH